MDLEELLNATTTGEYSADQIANAFERKYSEKTIEFVNSLDDSRKMIQITNKEIVINHKLAEHVLETFGRAITSVMINYLNLSEDQSKQITHFVSNYLIVEDIDDPSCIDLEFPELEQFSTIFPIPDQFVSFNESLIENFLRKNRQVRGIIVGLQSISFLKNVNEILPELYLLQMTTPIEPVNFLDGVYFENVRELCMNAVTDVIPSNVVFDRLEEIEFQSNRLVTKE